VDRRPNHLKTLHRKVTELKLQFTGRRRQRAKATRATTPAGRSFGPVPREIASLPQDPSRFTGRAVVTPTGVTTLRLSPAAVDMHEKACAVERATVIQHATQGIVHDADGWPIVVPFDEDEGFCTRLNHLVRTVHARWALMAVDFDEKATALRLRLRLDEKRHQAATDANALATTYAEQGTAAMTGLAAQIRQRMVADALAGAR